MKYNDFSVPHRNKWQRVLHHFSFALLRLSSRTLRETLMNQLIITSTNYRKNLRVFEGIK